MRGHGVLLEDIRSQNRATIEAVESTRAALEERIDRVDRDSRARDSVLETAIRDLRKTVEQNSADIRQNSADIRQNSADIRENSADVRSLAARVDALGPLDLRISVLERRSSQ
jgi:methyl-accepting chemotaxis protein